MGVPLNVSHLVFPAYSEVSPFIKYFRLTAPIDFGLRTRKFSELWC